LISEPKNYLRTFPFKGFC